MSQRTETTNCGVHLESSPIPHTFVQPRTTPTDAAGESSNRPLVSHREPGARCGDCVSCRRRTAATDWNQLSSNHSSAVDHRVPRSGADPTPSPQCHARRDAVAKRRSWREPPGRCPIPLRPSAPPSIPDRRVEGALQHWHAESVKERFRAVADSTARSSEQPPPCRCPTSPTDVHRRCSSRQS